LLMDKMPQIKLDKVDGITFIEQIMQPHTPYYPALKGLLALGILKGMAHITGGGIAGNLCRIIPAGLSAEIDLSKIQLPNIFKYIRNQGKISDSEMLQTFNCGVGLIIVARAKDKAEIIRHISQYHDCREIGTINKGNVAVQFTEKLSWL